MSQNRGNFFKEVLTGKRHQGIFCSDGNVLCLDLGGSYVGLYVCKNLMSVHLRLVHFTAR